MTRAQRKLGFRGSGVPPVASGHGRRGDARHRRKGRRTRGFRTWLERFYDLVEGDDLLSPVFGGTVSREHRDRVLGGWSELKQP